MGVVVLAVSNMSGEETLATKGGKALKYGDSITLMNIFNEYIIVTQTGRASAGGFDSYSSNNVLKLLSPKGKKGAVNYGDKTVLMGPNGKYLFTRYNGHVSCRASIIAAEPDGVTAPSHRATAMQKYTFGLPGSETGLRH